MLTHSNHFYSCKSHKAVVVDKFVNTIFNSAFSPHSAVISKDAPLDKVTPSAKAKTFVEEFSYLLLCSFLQLKLIHTRAKTIRLFTFLLNYSLIQNDS